MEDIAAFAILQMSGLGALYVELEEMDAHQRAQAQQVPRLYGPMIEYQNHQFRIDDLSDTQVRDFTR
jgi:hypothetical protein